MRTLTALALVLPLSGCITATVTELGTLGGRASGARDINPDGVVVGSAQTADGASRAVMWRGGAISEIPLAGRPGSVQAAFGVNGAEQVVGRMGTLEAAAHAFLWDRGATADLGSGAADSYAWDVNEPGDVAGERAVGAATQATLWTNGVQRDLRTLAGTHSIAFALEKHRQAVGRSTVAEGRDAPYHAVLWWEGEVLDLGTLGGRNSVAYGITVGRWPDAGYETTYIVGAAETGSGVEHAFVWNRGRMRDLGVLPGDVASAATGISARGIIVGYSRSREGNSRACMWTGGSLVDLNTLLPSGSGWVLHTAYAINNRRQIVGEGVYRGQPRGFLLTLSG